MSGSIPLGRDHPVNDLLPHDHVLILVSIECAVHDAGLRPLCAQRGLGVELERETTDVVCFHFGNMVRPLGQA